MFIKHTECHTYMIFRRDEKHRNAEIKVLNKIKTISGGLISLEKRSRIVKNNFLTENKNLITNLQTQQRALSVSCILKNRERY